MKRVALIIALFTAGFAAQAQTPYKTSIGLGIDLTRDVTYFGPQIKHVFDRNAAVQAQAMFSDNNTSYIGVDYQYIKNFDNSKYAAWYIGVGPELEFVNNHTDFNIRPQAGLDFRLPSTPLGAHVDWKPYWRLNHGGRFDGNRFTLGFKYLIK